MTITWRNWLSYPQYLLTDTVKIMDTLETLIDIKELPNDRYSAVAEFLTIAKNAGLITSHENDYMRNDIAWQL